MVGAIRWDAPTSVNRALHRSTIAHLVLAMRFGRHRRWHPVDYDTLCHATGSQFRQARRLVGFCLPSRATRVRELIDDSPRRKNPSRPFSESRRMFGFGPMLPFAARARAHVGTTRSTMLLASFSRPTRGSKPAVAGGAIVRCATLGLRRQVQPDDADQHKTNADDLQRAGRLVEPGDADGGGQCRSSARPNRVGDRQFDLAEH